MGMDLHELLLAKRVSDERGHQLGEVLTIGRQWLIVEEQIVNRIVGRQVAPSRFVENVFKELGASSVSALDASDYEGAEIVQDLNVQYEGHRQFDCVADFGSTEHVFNISTALQTIAKLVKIGGVVLHAFPANNLLSHGFWQVSADVFFEFYCQDNGFNDTEVFYASGLDRSNWWQVRRCRPGERFEVASLEPIIVLCNDKQDERSG